MESGRLRSRMLEKLSLEDYARFVGSGKQYNLTCELLKQVIHMHGFRKGKKAKSILTDAVKSIELMDPTRSTLKDDDVSSYAFISLAEAVKDLGELNWQECCITSIQMVNSSNYTCPAPVNEPSSTGIEVATSSRSALVKRKRRLRKLAAIEDATSGGEGEGVGSAESACCSGGGGDGQGGNGIGGGDGRVRKSRTKTLARFVGLNTSG